MTALTDLVGQTLRWAKDAGCKRSYVLEGPAGPVAHLGFARSWGCGSLATGRTDYGEWTFKREGFLHPRINVRRAGIEATAGVFSLSGMGNGVLTIAGNGEYKLTTSGWLHRSWEFTSGGSIWLRFEQHHGGATVQIVTGGLPPESLSLLLLLGWYFPVLADEDAAAIAASTAAVIATM